MRYIHLTLAIIASLFFALVSVTGIIIGIDNIDRQYPSYKAAHLDQITLAQSIAGVKEAYQEVNTSPLILVVLRLSKQLTRRVQRLKPI